MTHTKQRFLEELCWLVIISLVKQYTKGVLQNCPKRARMQVLCTQYTLFVQSHIDLVSINKLFDPCSYALLI